MLFRSMNRYYGTTILGKLSFHLFDKIRFATMMSIDQDEGHGYNHAFKYNPDGMGAGYGKTNFFTFQWNHLFTNTMFYDLKISSTKNYSGGYLHENPLDSNTDNLYEITVIATDGNNNSSEIDINIAVTNARGLLGLFD